ncbi:TPA: hypothetical protein DIV55_03440 [Patescibacteria group bacterium]|uniref:Glycosyltransferase/rhamnosyltransferase n=1 Tax=Candidatus Gottesmanbacteria bacterium GW2011_GWA1_43_11 TaxID=1618436 RepID=A0A0G1CI59_9BACT|nr:MAG: Glycosyltransferase/rhamnosyltransferase [Candidatus Gottesmanbacteria bacterium GW2011_GWA1_43_11]HCS78773.1 hypothetical protein [Patescibacteria group bacterium]
MKKAVDLSIIIVSYNTWKLTDQCLESIFTSLANTSISYEVIVVDNASKDRSPELIKKHYPAVRLLSNKENAGYGKGNNQGIRAATGSVVLLLNSDILVLDQAIEKLYRFFMTLPAKSIAGGKLFNPDYSPQDSCGPGYTLPVIFTALFLKGDHLHLTRYSPNEVRSVDWVMGACIVARRADFTAVGGFDENIFMYMEEIDWQYRAKQQGYGIIFYPQAHFIHKGAASSSGHRTPILNVFQGLKYFYKKHYSLAANLTLQVLLVYKSLLAIGLFTLLNRKNDQKLYVTALKLALS